MCTQGLHCLKEKQAGSDQIESSDDRTQSQWQHGSFEITCCGTAISADLKHVLVGDFLGNVQVFATENPPESETSRQIVSKVFIGTAIRYIHFHDFLADVAFVGCMGGAVHLVMPVHKKDSGTAGEPTAIDW